MLSLHERAGEVFLAALSRPAAERDAFLVAACKGDEELLREVGSLLMFHEAGDAADPRSLAEREEFSAGDVFGGRYRMITRVGRGGMGDVWRADDLILETPVALKLIHSASPSDRIRILQEVRLARQITHPGVCRVFDVGEAGETIFFTMEFVQGEDLAALLKRTGRLTSERVVEIAHQLCAGLAAAHAAGVLHRDLKPANVLIDQEGRVRITDFGIAVTTSDAGPHVMIGTLGYMAPEQLTADAPVSERTDVYALGVILYELVTGKPHHRLRSEDPSSRLSRLAPGINPQLERAILKAIERDPEERPATAVEMAAALPDIDAAEDSARTGRLSKRIHRIPVWLAGAAVVVAVVAVAAFAWTRPAHTALTARDTIILADFLNTTGDPVFDSTLKVALAVALEQSPFLKVFPDDRAHEDLPLMQRSPSEGITRAIARQIAEREQLKALVAGSITSLGRHYVVGLEAVNAQSGDVMAREQVEVASKEEVLTSLGAAASRLRRELGESLASIQRYDVPLPQATTPSLEALHAYALAIDEGRINDQRLESIPHLKRAIELDPHFALAMAQLSGTYTNTWQSALAPEWSLRAFELRDRVSERERYMISWRYYRDATQAWDKGLELARAWTDAYPRESTAFNGLGRAAWALGQYQRALTPFRESIRLDPRFFAPRLNLLWTLTALNQFDEAKRVLDGARAANVHSIGFPQMAYILAFIENDTATMTRELDAAVALPEGAWAANWQPRISAFGGRIASAHEEFRRSAAVTSHANLTELSGLYSAQDAISHAVVGQCAAARSEAGAAVDLSRDNFTLESAARALAWCGADADASQLSAELARRFPDAILTTHVILPVIAAATALRNGKPARGLELLEPVRPFDHAQVAEFWPAYLRGEAQLQLKHSAEAAAEFRSIIDHRGELADAPLYPLAHLGLARALASGVDRSGARQAYLAFFTLWKDADPNLLPLQEARREFARLQQ
jgi:tetratricopeptide (TPR) repeat protein/predicted Ser/Thr protein kinase